MKRNRSASAQMAAVTRKRRVTARKAALARQINAALRNGADPSPHALSIRQPYVEQIMRGTKRIEYRSMPTHITGQIFICASETPGPAEEFEKNANARAYYLPLRAAQRKPGVR